MRRPGSFSWRCAITRWPTGSGRLLDQLSYECYLTDQLARARASGLEALAIYEREQDTRATGVSQRWLSRLSWFLGQNEDSERYAVAAVATLEPLGPGRDLAMAYSNLAQLRMLAGDTAEAVRWATRRSGWPATPATARPRSMR